MCIQHYVTQEYQPTLLGTIPQLGEAEAMEALDAACNAYDKGIMAHYESSRPYSDGNFVEQVKTKREEVVKLLMWEIGKNLADSQKEFDRTIEYITILLKIIKIWIETQLSFKKRWFTHIRRGPWA